MATGKNKEDLWEKLMLKSQKNVNNVFRNKIYWTAQEFDKICSQLVIIQPFYNISYLKNIVRFLDCWTTLSKLYSLYTIKSWDN
jgi:hypothetical protein